MEGKIKICYIMPNMARGGAERFLIDLIASLPRETYEPSVILFKGKGAGYDELASLNIDITVIEKYSKIDINNFRSIYRKIKVIKPTIVHTQLGGDVRGRIAAWLAGVKVIVSTEQNTNIGEHWFIRILKTLTAGLTTAIIPISNAVATDLRQRYHLSLAKTALIIPNGIDLEKYPYQETRPTQTPLIAGAVGRLTAQKGFDLLIDAWQQYRPEGIKLVIAGSGTEEQNLKQQIADAGLESQITLYGDVTDMPAFYQQLNLLIAPSRWEGLGIAALEAGASGVPVVASAIGGMKDFITEQTGWNVEAGSREELGKKILSAVQAIRDGQTTAKQRALRSLIEQQYSIAGVTNTYSEFYLKSLGLYENPSSK